MKSRCFFVIIESKSILDLITAMEDIRHWSVKEAADGRNMRRRHEDVPDRLIVPSRAGTLPDNIGTDGGYSWLSIRQ